MKCPVCNETEVVPLVDGVIPDCKVCVAAIYDAAHEEQDPDELEGGVNQIFDDWAELNPEEFVYWDDDLEVTIH